MNGQNEENLNELFGKFLDDKQVDEAVEDIQKGEQIFLEHPAPEPDEALIAGIKAEVARTLVGRKGGVFRRMAYKAAVAAAAVIILAIMSIRLLEKDVGEPERVISMIPGVIWDSDDISADDADLAILTTAIEQVEDEVLTLELGENGGNGSRAVTELEMELIAIESDFWEG